MKTKMLTCYHYQSLQPYEPIWNKMRNFNDQRDDNTHDQLWLLEHLPVYTQGKAGKPEHILYANDIPIVHSDRGGQVTYHGPGQLMVYTLFDIHRLGMNTRTLVRQQEAVIIDLLSLYGHSAHQKEDAPGVYVNNKKIASIGLRVRKGKCYHGMALNIDMDLSPFDGINPCGFQTLKMTQMSDLNTEIDKKELKSNLIKQIEKHFNLQASCHFQRD